MEINEILKQLEVMPIPAEGYRIFPDGEKSYYGKDKLGNLIFAIESNNVKPKPFIQKTKQLVYFYNKKFNFEILNNLVEKTVHMLIYQGKGNDDIFIRLTKAFALNNNDEDQEYLTNLFISLKKLFANEHRANEMELQGLYAELYVILFFAQEGCSIVDYWQSKNKMKFDFSFNANKRLEIKSTIKSNRIHKFRHEQLLSDIYDIKVVSVMLWKNDQGESLYELLNKVYDLYQDNVKALTHISEIVSNIPPTELELYKYDKDYTIKNMKFYNVDSIPHFSEETPDGVSNAEYDCDLNNLSGITLDNLIEWIRRN